MTGHKTSNFGVYVGENRKSLVNSNASINSEEGTDIFSPKTSAEFHLSLTSMTDSKDIDFQIGLGRTRRLTHLDIAKTRLQKPPYMDVVLLFKQIAVH